jgi:hypothetical protein
MSIGKILREFQKQNHLFANWPQNQKLRLGDYGIIKNGQLDIHGNIKDINVTFRRSSERRDDYMNLRCGKKISITVQLQGSVEHAVPELPEGAAGMKIRFGGGHGLVVKGKATTVESIQNVGDLTKQLKNALKNAQWRKDYCVVTQIIKTKPGALFGAEHAGSEIVLEASGAANRDAIFNVDASARISAVRESDSAQSIITNVATAALFRCHKLRRQPAIIGRHTMKRAAKRRTAKR